MKKTLSAFTLIEVLVALTMISFLTLTGLKMSYQHLSSYRFWRFQTLISEYVGELEQLALGQASFSDADLVDRQWHLYGEFSDGELSLSRFESTPVSENSQVRMLSFYEVLDMDHFPLLVSDLILKNAETEISGQAFLMSWLGPLSQWQMSLLPASYTSLSRDFEFSVDRDLACSLPSSCQLQFQLQEPGGVGYSFSLSSGADLSRERLLLL